MHDGVTLTRPRAERATALFAGVLAEPGTSAVSVAVRMRGELG